MGDRLLTALQASAHPETPPSVRGRSVKDILAFVEREACSCGFLLGHRASCPRAPRPPESAPSGRWTPGSRAGQREMWCLDGDMQIRVWKWDVSEGWEAHAGLAGYLSVDGNNKLFPTREAAQAAVERRLAEAT